MKNNFLKKGDSAGFTLVETLVAISIVVIMVNGAFTAVQKSLSSTDLSKQGVIAYYLAQEGVEVIRNIRDENGLKGFTAPGNWLSRIANAGDPCAIGAVGVMGKTCSVDATSNTLTECSGDIDTCPLIRKDASTGFYGYNPDGAPTLYRRGVTLTRVSDNEVSMVVTIKWTKGILPQEFRIRENILNWQ